MLGHNYKGRKKDRKKKGRMKERKHVLNFYNICHLHRFPLVYNLHTDLKMPRFTS